MQLSEHFHLSEFERSDRARKLGISNAAPPAVLANLQRLAVALEAVRAVLGVPVLINSGYRSPELNKATPGSAKASAHMDGRAADIIAPKYGPPLEVIRAIVANRIPFDKLIYEHAAWVHFAIPRADEEPRRQLLTIDVRGTREGVEGVWC